MSALERRGVVIVLVGLMANAALDLSGYESDRWAAAAWVVVALGVAYLLWPGIPRRLVDRTRGARGWKARVVWEPFAGHGVGLQLDHPEEDAADLPVMCEVEDPDGRLDLVNVSPPGSSVANGVPSPWYFALFSREDRTFHGPSPPLPLDHGWYRVTWYSTRGTVGRKMLDVHWFKVRSNGTLRG